LGGASFDSAAAANPKHKRNHRQEQHPDLSAHIQDPIIYMREFYGTSMASITAVYESVRSVDLALKEIVQGNDLD